MTNSTEQFMRRIFGVSDQEFDRQVRVTRLATYNAEAGRGLVHTPEWVAYMAEEQAWFNSEVSSLDSEQE